MNAIDILTSSPGRLILLLGVFGGVYFLVRWAKSEKLRRTQEQILKTEIADKQALLEANIKANQDLIKDSQAVDEFLHEKQ